MSLGKRHYKGFVLAAGFGTRLVPITHTLPKPLLPFLGLPVLDLALHKLNVAGVAIENIAVNAHHLSEIIRLHIETHPLYSGVKLSLEADILGTGGALNALHDWIGNDDLIIYNGDIVSDIAIDEAIRLHEEESSLATLIVLPKALPGKNPLFCHNNRLISIGTRPEKSHLNLVGRTFTGVHILSNKFIKNHIPRKDYWHITDFYCETLAANFPISCYLHSGYWYDIGTPWEYFKTQIAFLSASSLLSTPSFGYQQLEKKLGRSGKSILFGKDTRTKQIDGPSFIGSNISLCPTWKIGARSIILSQPNLVEGLHFENCLVFGDILLEPHSLIENQILFGTEHLNFTAQDMNGHV